jgi:5'-nucleotidase
MKLTPWKTALGTALSAALIAAPLAAVPANAVEVSPAANGTSPVVINEAYLSGGSSGAAFKNKFVELYNSSETPVSLEGWSVQYRSATGTGTPSSVVALSGSIAAKGYYLLQGGSNGTTGADLPAADATAAGFNPAGGGGTIVLAKQSGAINPLPTGSVIEPANVADLLGYGSSNTFETQAAAAPSGNTDVKSLNRGGGADTNNNSADITLNATITPKSANGAAPGPVDPPVDPGPGTPPASKTIAEIQGNGATSPLAGALVSTFLL